MTKNELRKKYKKQRARLATQEVEEKSLAIANMLLNQDIWGYSYYHIFLPITHLNEVNTEYILHILQGKDKHIVVSKTDFDSHTLTHFLLTDQTRFEKNKWGIPEPIGGIEIAPSCIDVVFVPLLVVDKQGNRVGYGKGFYDRFLQQAAPKKAIGLSFFPLEDQVLDADSHDYPLTSCCLPDKYVVFGK